MYAYVHTNPHKHEHTYHETHLFECCSNCIKLEYCSRCRNNTENAGHRHVCMVPLDTGLRIAVHGCNRSMADPRKRVYIQKDLHLSVDIRIFFLYTEVDRSSPYRHANAYWTANKLPSCKSEGLFQWRYPTEEFRDRQEWQSHPQKLDQTQFPP